MPFYHQIHYLLFVQLDDHPQHNFYQVLLLIVYVVYNIHVYHQLFENHQNREHLKSQILETILIVSTDNEIDHLEEIATNVLLNMIGKSSTNFKNVSIVKKNRARNTTASIRFAY